MSDFNSSNVVVFRRAGAVHSALVQWNPWLEREEVNGEALEGVKETSEWVEIFEPEKKRA